MFLFKKIIFFSLLTLFVLGGIFWIFSKKNQDTGKTENIEKTEFDFNRNSTSTVETPSPKNSPEERVSIPENFLIKNVPFTSQAPFAKWDEYHEEACEEASLIMLKYFEAKKTLTREIAEKEIQALIKYEIKNYGDYRDSNAGEIAKLAKDFYGLDLKVVYDFRKEDIKEYLSKGGPIIIPAAGRELKNPNFKFPGPLYHNLVLVGYDGDTIIANDPGTKKGENYEYHLNVLYEAIHDFPGAKEKIITGRKAMLVLP